MRTLTILLFGLTFSFCNQSQAAQDNILAQDSIENNVNQLDRITELFDKALNSDTVEFNNEFEFYSYKSFLFFKSGQIVSKTEKNALVVVCPTDTTYAVSLYSIQNKKWNLIDSINDLDAFPTQFDPIFADFNFDGQTDIYIQVSASNGWSLSRGHLLIIDPLTKKLIRHAEARNLANMKPDPKTKTVVSELWNGYNAKGQSQLTIFTNKWVNGKLTTVKKKHININ